jgi:hypothetical protein
MLEGRQLVHRRQDLPEKWHLLNLTEELPTRGRRRSRCRRRREYRSVHRRHGDRPPVLGGAGTGLADGEDRRDDCPDNGEKCCATDHCRQCMGLFPDV